MGLDRDADAERPRPVQQSSECVGGTPDERRLGGFVVANADEDADDRRAEVGRQRSLGDGVVDRSPDDGGIAADQVRVRRHGDGHEAGCLDRSSKLSSAVAAPRRSDRPVRTAAPLDAVEANLSRLADHRLRRPFGTGEGAECELGNSGVVHLDIIRLTTYGRAVAEGARRVVDHAEAVVIGGGVVGCAVLLELAMRGIEAVLLEAESDVGEGTSKANSAIIHTGFDAKAGTIEAGLLRRSAERWPELLDDLGVPSLACGALMLARNGDEAARLEDAARDAESHGVLVELVDGGWLRDAAPYVTDTAIRALHVPDEAIVDPFWLTRAYVEAAIGQGARVVTRAAVTAVTVTPDAVEIATADGSTIRATQAFDCAGLRADDVARLAGDTSFAITPRKGEFVVSERTAGVDRIVLPIPGPLGKGMLVTPIVFGGVLLGPTADDGTDKSDRSTTADGVARILESCRGLVPGVAEMAPIRTFAGVRAVSSTGDYIIRSSTAGDRLTIVAGIRSTGISASPAIAEAAVDVAARVARLARPPVGRPRDHDGSRARRRPRRGRVPVPFGR